MEIPRPTPEEWGDCKSEVDAGNFENEEEYLEEWKIWNPRETNWVEINSLRFNENRNLLFSVESTNYCTISNTSRFWDQEDKQNGTSYQWFLDAIFPYLNELVDDSHKIKLHVITQIYGK